MLHPEYAGDFENRGGYPPVYDSEFKDYPEPLLDLDRQIGQLRVGGPNCVKMDGPGTISGLSLVRMQDLSVHRRYMTVQGRQHDSSAGKYHLSIIMLAENRVQPADAQPVLRVTLTARDVANPTLLVSHVFDVPGEAFYDGGTPITNRVIEYHLAPIELRLDSLIPTRSRVFNIVDWRVGTFPADLRLDTTNAVGLPADELAQGVYDDFDISIEYLGTTSGDIFVDAICLSNPPAYALFRPDDPNCAPPYAGYNQRFLDRLDNILFEDPAAATPTLHSRLRLIYGAEQDWNSGGWCSTRLFSQRLSARSNGAVRLYTPTSGWSDPSRLTELMDLYNSGVSGYYLYPIHWDVPTPREPIDELYNRLYLDTASANWNMQFITRRYRDYAESRKDFGNSAPWIPYIQNHSNMYIGSHTAWDGDPLREPTAAEVRVQCNLALAYGADGIMFYQFSQMPIDTTVVDSAYWPPTRVEWERNDAKRQTAMGSIGFLNRYNTPRFLDTHGENKWDSARSTIAKTRTLGQFMLDDTLTWQCGRSWYGNRSGTSVLVRGVIATRQDAVWPIDAVDSTIVETTEFLTPSGIRYVFVLNGRTDTLGHRHIIIKPGTSGATVDEWRVTNVLTNDVWIVRATDTPDATSYDNGFTEYFAPGAAALYRLDPMIEESTDFTFDSDADCATYSRSIYIEPQATLRLDDKDVCGFGTGHGLFCDGQLVADGTIFRGCGSEPNWRGIFARNGGVIELEHIEIHNAPVTAASGGTVTLDQQCRIYLVNCALWNIEGTLHSTGTESYMVNNHLIHVGTSISSLLHDHAYGLSSFGSTGVSVHSNVEAIYVDESTFEGFWRGAFAFAGNIVGDFDRLAPADGGNNSFRTMAHGLEAVGGGWISLGAYPDTLYDLSAKNEILLIDPNAPQAETDAISGILARNCWWEPANWSASPPAPWNFSGNVEYVPLLAADPIPFAGSTGSSFASGSGLSKSAAAPPPPTTRGQIISAIAARNHGLVRHLAGQFLTTPAAVNADVGFLGFLHQSLRESRSNGVIDSLLTLCLTRPDVESKLLAADIVATDGLHFDAVQILNGYSFAGSADLLKRSLLRKALWYPHASTGGFVDGLRCADSLESLQDSLLLRAMEFYPLVYSRLSTPTTPVPKKSTARIIDRALPTSIDVWPNYPNPFSDVTSFTFKLGEDKHVRLAIYDAMGREVHVITDADYHRGVHSAVLRSGDLPNGLYFYRLTTDEGVIQRKMLLMR